MGSFDIGHRELLRTCSEPDLASLFRTMNEEPKLKTRVKSLDEISTVNEEVKHVDVILLLHMYEKLSVCMFITCD